MKDLRTWTKEFRPSSGSAGSLAACLVAVTSLVGCGGSASSPVPTVDVAPILANICLEGVVVTAPSRIRLDAAPDEALTGPGLEMLGSLPVDPVTRVRVCGIRRVGSDGEAVLYVENLHLISIAGDPASTGVMLGSGGIWRLQPTSPAEGAHPIPLSDVQVPLAPWRGERVWVAGPMQGEKLVVHRIGSLDPSSTVIDGRIPPASIRPGVRLP